MFSLIVFYKPCEDCWHCLWRHQEHQENQWCYPGGYRDSQGQNPKHMFTRLFYIYFFFFSGQTMWIAKAANGERLLNITSDQVLKLFRTARDCIINDIIALTNFILFLLGTLSGSSGLPVTKSWTSPGLPGMPDLESCLFIINMWQCLGKGTISVKTMNWVIHTTVEHFFWSIVIPRL